MDYSRKSQICATCAYWEGDRKVLRKIWRVLVQARPVESACKEEFLSLALGPVGPEMRCCLHKRWTALGQSPLERLLRSTLNSFFSAGNAIAWMIRAAGLSIVIDSIDRTICQIEWLIFLEMINGDDDLFHHVVIAGYHYLLIPSFTLLYRLGWTTVMQVEDLANEDLSQWK